MLDTEYKRGYIVAKSFEVIQNIIPKDFKLFTTKNYIFAYDKLEKFQTHEFSSVSVSVFGDIYSLDNSELVSKELAIRLQKNEKDFFTYLKSTYGRFLIIYTINDKVSLLTDATSMRSLFYKTFEKEIVCTSHPYLLTKAKSKIQFPLKYGYPGNLTPLEDVKILTPNTMLDLNNGKITRFFPTLMPSYKKKFTYKEVSNNFIAHMKIVLPKVLSQYPNISMSLTAGIDSRITFALIKLVAPEYLKKIKFFTYKNKIKDDEFDADVDVTKIIAKEYGLNHVVYNRDDYKDTDLIKKVEDATYYHST